MRKQFAAFAIGAGILLAPMAAGTILAYDPQSISAVNTDAGGVAMRGYDPVAYFTVGKPIQKRWLEDVPGNVTKAAQNWPKISKRAPKDL